MGSGEFMMSTEASMVPDDSLSIRDRAIAAWPPAWHGQNLRDIVTTLGFDIDKPWRDLSRRIAIGCCSLTSSRRVPVYPGCTRRRCAGHQAQRAAELHGDVHGRRRYVLHTFATTQSALMKKRVSRYHGQHAIVRCATASGSARSSVCQICRAGYRGNVARYL